MFLIMFMFVFIWLNVFLCPIDIMLFYMLLLCLNCLSKYYCQFVLIFMLKCIFDICLIVF